MEQTSYVLGKPLNGLLWSRVLWSHSGTKPLQSRPGTNEADWDRRHWQLYVFIRRRVLFSSAWPVRFVCCICRFYTTAILGIQWSLLPAIKYWRQGTFRLDVDCVMERRPLRLCVIRHRWPTTKQVDSYSNTEATAQTLHDSTEPGMYLAIGAKLRFPMYNRSQDTR